MAKSVKKASKRDSVKTKKKAPKKTPAKAVKKPASSAGRAPSGKNTLGVENSLVNNINARKKKGISRPKSKSTITKKSYTNMQNKWGKK